MCVPKQSQPLLLQFVFIGAAAMAMDLLIPRKHAVESWEDVNNICEAWASTLGQQGPCAAGITI